MRRGEDRIVKCADFKRDSARAGMHTLVKRIREKYGYAPDLADKAVQGVLAQAELLLREIN